MSEIWTPKGPAPQQPSGGIELPKGFARRRTDEEKKEEAKEEPQAEASGPAPEQTPPAPPAGGARPAPRPRQAGQRPEFLFPPQGVQVQCPNCGTPFTAAVFSIVDLGANPELREPLLSGQVNAAICQNCGAGGPLSAPLMVHDPENEFLGVMVPSQARLQDAQAQRVIGEMSKALMNRLPNEQRRGYMLNPRQFFDWDSLLEVLWGFEGVTPEMLRTQRDQSELITSLVRLAPDVKAMQMVADRRPNLINRDFFALLGQVIGTLSQQGQETQQAAANALVELRNHLLETTEAGKAVKATEEVLRGAMSRLSPSMSRDDFLDLLLEYWDKGEDGESIVVSLMSIAQGLVDYQFLMALTNRIDETDDPEARAPLLSLRELVVEFSQQAQQGQAQSREAMLQQVQAFLQDVLQAPDPQALMEQRSDELNEVFLAVLASNIEQAQQKNATFAVKRLQAIYTGAMSILQENLPPELKLMNQLVSTHDEKEVRRLLQENREILSQEWVDNLREMEERFRAENNRELASRLKSIRIQAAMLL